MCIDLWPETFLQFIKKKEKFYWMLHWHHSYCSVMQRFLKVTFSYQPKNYLEIKLWVMTKSKTDTYGTNKFIKNN